MSGMSLKGWTEAEKRERHLNQMKERYVNKLYEETISEWSKEFE